jgi:ketosteroid isomerase-like protein
VPGALAGSAAGANRSAGEVGAVAENLVPRFVEALAHLEDGGDVEPMVSLFSEDCVISNVLAARGLHGRDLARRFWSNYRDTFRDVHSEFRNIVIAGSRAALEWSSRGATRDDVPIEYEGTSILEVEDGAIIRFVAYFDPRKVGRSVERRLHPSAAAP